MELCVMTKQRSRISALPRVVDHRTQMTDQTMDPNANSDAFYAGALTRISNSMIVLAVLFTGGSWFLYGGCIALGLACGCAIAYVNFFWLKRVVTALADHARETSQPQSSKGVVLRFLLRYVLIAVAAYVIFSVSPASL